VIDILHVVIHALDHMMTGRTECDKILPLLFCVVERADGGKLCCDLVGSQRINPAAALPLADLFQFKSQSFCGNSGIVVKILCLVLQSTARKIAVFHSITSLSVRRKQRTALCCLMIPRQRLPGVCFRYPAERLLLSVCLRWTEVLQLPRQSGASEFCPELHPGLPGREHSGIRPQYRTLRASLRKPLR